MRILVWLVLASLASTPATQVRPAHAAAPDVTLTVTVTPSTIRPGESSRVRIRLLSGGRVLAPAVGTFIVNVTITTLGDLALAKRTWVQEEIKERRLSVFWPLAGASTEMSPNRDGG